MKTTRRLRLLSIAILTCLCSATAIADNAKPDLDKSSIDKSGTATGPAFAIPYSSYASPEGEAMFQRVLADGKKAPSLLLGVEPSRTFYDKINTDRASRMQKIYPVTIHTQTIGGVRTDVVLPANGIAATQKHRVLINLHGGGFLWGAHSGGLVESIPIASLGRIKVVTVDYREGPEHAFPAASEDVTAVYTALLKQYPAKNIGIYGCSAGGVLTGEAVAWIISRKLPVPGAIGTFCGSIAEFSGDSSYVAPMLNGQAVPNTPLKLASLPYFARARADDPMVFPANSPALLAKFPPTLLISGTRDFAMSTEVQSQRLLAAAGVDAELHLWDGMWHSFFSDPEMPESREAYGVIEGFFDRHLGR